MLRTRLRIEDQEFIDELRRRRTLVGPALLGSMQEARLNVIQRIVSKLSGKLARSITGDLAESYRGRGGAYQYGDLRAMAFIGSSHPGAKAIEKGSYYTHPGGQPFLVIGGRTLFLRKGTLRPDGSEYPVTAPHQIRLGKRPAAADSLREARPQIRASLLRHLKAVLEGSGSA